MRVLVAVASRHGSTQGIADALRAEGARADIAKVDDVIDIVGYDGVVLGSAVYMGNWLPEARRFVERHALRLATLPVWLFSSGPLGDQPQPDANPRQLDELLTQTGAREHRVFAGSLDRADLGLGERLVVRVVHAPYGDFRDWDAIRGWGREIGAALAPTISLTVGAEGRGRDGCVSSGCRRQPVAAGGAEGSAAAARGRGTERRRVQGDRGRGR